MAGAKQDASRPHGSNRRGGSLRQQKLVLAGLERRFEMTEDATLADLVHYRPGRDQPFHRWFRFREGYAPELVTRAIRAMPSKPQLVLDPFCGSGATLLGARTSAVPSIGVDINPVAALIARTKLRKYSRARLMRIREVARALSSIRRDAPTAPNPPLSIINQIFKPDILQALLATRRVIEREEDEFVRDLLLVGWLATLEEVSNVFKEGNGIKYRNRKRTPSGYVTIPWETTPAFQHDGFALVRARLHSQYSAMLADVDSLSSETPGTVYEGSALDLPQFVQEETVDLCMFSPPYCNNFNYMKIFKVELWMGAFVRSYSELRAITNRALRSHVETKLALPAKLDLPEELLAAAHWIGQRELWNARIPASVLAYFVDMQVVLKAVHNSLRRGGQCQIIVGNSAYAGILVATDVLLAEIGRTVGFEVERIVVARHLTTSSQQTIQLNGLRGALRESVVVLRKA